VKSLTLRLAAALIAFSCHIALAQDACPPVTAEAMVRQIFPVTTEAGIWEVRAEAGACGFDIHLDQAVDAKTGPRQLLALLNRKWPTPGVALRAVRENTVYLKVRDDELLTQRMGSTGALLYLATVTFSLTSLPGIDREHFSFVEGDHAQPGYYSRASFVRSLFFP